MQGNYFDVELQPGDIVFVIDEEHTGNVLRVENNWVYFEDEDGFEYAYPKYQLIKKNKGEEADYLIREEPLKIKKERIKESKVRSSLSYNFSGTKPAFDLHIEELSPNMDFQTNHDALLFQLNCVEEIIHQAELAACRNLVFIHGVGKGKLRDSLRQLLREKYTHIEFLDASYQQYGVGATELIIHKKRNFE